MLLSEARGRETHTDAPAVAATYPTIAGMGIAGTAAKRFYLSMVAFLAALAVLEFVLSRALDVRLAEQGFAGAWPLVFVCGVCALAASPFPRLREIPPLFLTAILSWEVLCMLPVLAMRAIRTAPLADGRLSAIDALAGLNVGAVVQFVRAHPALDTASSIIYWKVALTMIAAAVLLPPLVGHAEAARHYIAAVAIGVVLTTLLFVFAPAAGPWTLEGFAPNALQSELTRSILSIRSDAVLTKGYAGVISFPSFHCTFAILTAYALSCVRWLRWTVWILAALVCASTITTGWHYAVDVPGGIAVAFLAIAAARWVVPTSQR